MSDMSSSNQEADRVQRRLQRLTEKTVETTKAADGMTIFAIVSSLLAAAAVIAAIVLGVEMDKKSKKCYNAAFTHAAKMEREGGPFEGGTGDASMNARASSFLRSASSNLKAGMRRASDGAKKLQEVAVASGGVGIAMTVLFVAALTAVIVLGVRMRAFKDCACPPPYTKASKMTKKRLRVAQRPAFDMVEGQHEEGVHQDMSAFMKAISEQGPAQAVLGTVESYAAQHKMTVLHESADVASAAQTQPVLVLPILVSQACMAEADSIVAQHPELKLITTQTAAYAAGFVDTSDVHSEDRKVSVLLPAAGGAVGGESEFVRNLAEAVGVQVDTTPSGPFLSLGAPSLYIQHPDTAAEQQAVLDAATVMGKVLQKTMLVDQYGTQNLRNLLVLTDPEPISEQSKAFVPLQSGMNAAVVDNSVPGGVLQVDMLQLKGATVPAWLQNTTQSLVANTASKPPTESWKGSQVVSLTVQDGQQFQALLELDAVWKRVAAAAQQGTDLVDLSEEMVSHVIMNVQPPSSAEEGVTMRDMNQQILGTKEAADALLQAMVAFMNEDPGVEAMQVLDTLHAIPAPPSTALLLHQGTAVDRLAMQLVNRASADAQRVDDILGRKGYGARVALRNLMLVHGCTVDQLKLVRSEDGVPQQAPDATHAMVLLPVQGGTLYRLVVVHVPRNDVPGTPAFTPVGPPEDNMSVEQLYGAMLGMQLNAVEVLRAPSKPLFDSYTVQPLALPYDSTESAAEVAQALRASEGALVADGERAGSLQQAAAAMNLHGADIAGAGSAVGAIGVVAAPYHPGTAALLRGTEEHALLYAQGLVDAPTLLQHSLQQYGKGLDMLLIVVGGGTAAADAANIMQGVREQLEPQYMAASFRMVVLYNPRALSTTTQRVSAEGPSGTPAVWNGDMSQLAETLMNLTSPTTLCPAVFMGVVNNSGPVQGLAVKQQQTADAVPGVSASGRGKPRCTQGTYLAIVTDECVYCKTMEEDLDDIVAQNPQLGKVIQVVHYKDALEGGLLTTQELNSGLPMLKYIDMNLSLYTASIGHGRDGKTDLQGRLRNALPLQ